MISNLPSFADGAISAPTTRYILNSEEAFTLFPKPMTQKFLSYGPGLKTLDLLTFALEGRAELVPNYSQESFIENYPLNIMTIGAITSIGTVPGGVCSFTLSSDEITADFNIFPREGSQWIFGTADDYVEVRIPVGGIVSSAGGTVQTITVRPNDITKTLSATYMYAGAIGSYAGISKAVGTGGVASTKKGYDHIYWYAQLFKEALGFDGMALASEVWWTDGSGKFMYNDRFADVEFLLRAGMNSQLWMGQLTTNTAMTEASSVNTAESNQVYTTEGVWTAAGLRGWDKGYDETAGFLVTDLDEVGEYQRSMGIGGDTLMFMLGNGLYQSAENNCVKYITNATGSLNYLFTPTNGQDHDLTIGFKTIRKNGYNYAMIEEASFNNPKMLKNIMFSSGCIVPVSTVKTKQGAEIPNLSVAYVGNSTYNRKMVVGMLSGGDGFGQQIFDYPQVTEIDGNRTLWLSHMMVRLAEAWKVVRVYPTS